MALVEIMVDEGLKIMAPIRRVLLPVIVILHVQSVSKGDRGVLQGKVHADGGPGLKPKAVPAAGTAWLGVVVVIVEPAQCGGHTPWLIRAHGRNLSLSSLDPGGAKRNQTSGSNHVFH